jgi:hypothetical protein
MEAIVDACDSSESAIGWYYYLDGKMKVPFTARYGFARPISVRHGAGRGVRERNVCLGSAGRLLSIWRNCNHCRKIKRPRRPVGDCLYWVDRGREL